MPPHKPQRKAVESQGPPQWGVWLSWAAFVLAAALVLARSMMLETLRNPLEVQPGAEPVPRGPGAGTGLVLDLLCCVPALIVLARRALDRTFSLRFAWSFAPMALLALWTVASTAWAGDKFAAVVGGTHWLCACALLWSVAQLVSDWARLRLLAAVCVGVLLVQVGQGLYYRFVEHPDLVEEFRKHREELIRQRGWEPGSFIAEQFEKRVTSGEMMGFTSSPNSYGAVLVLLLLVAAGVAVQRAADRDGAAWAAVPAVAAALGVVVVAMVGSRTAVATTGLGVATLAALAVLRRPLSRHSRLVYAGGLAAFVLGAAAIVGHGFYHGTLFHDSLTFRWRYWVAAGRLFADHPLAGVGWENFGPHYLAYRLPIAAEEIKDPHNFLVRFATELGAAGLLLAVAWMLELWWDVTQKPLPAQPAEAEEPATPARPSLAVVTAIGSLGVTVNVVASLDWTQGTAYNALEVVRRAGFLCLFVLGAAASALRSAQRQDPDERGAPWIAFATTVGLGLFLLHNLVDFSLFEPGPMYLFACLCGGVLGIRLAGTEAVPRVPRAAALAGAAAAVACGLVALGGLAVPVGMAEREADDGDEALRTGRFTRAASHYRTALDTVGYNADYAFRAARAALLEPPPGNTRAALSLLDSAIRSDPSRPQYWLHRANARLRAPAPDAAAVRADYEQALRLDPNNVDVRIEYAEVLNRFGDRAAAAEQYRQALRYNDLLSPDEPKRLPRARLEAVRAALDAASR
jgi:O-antigen ligase